MASLTASQLKRDLIDYRIRCWLANATYTKDSPLAAFSFDHIGQQSSQDPKVMFISTNNPDWYLRVTLYDELQNDEALDSLTKQQLEDTRHSFSNTIQQDTELVVALDILLDEGIEELSICGLWDLELLAGLGRTEKVGCTDYLRWM
ncbi:hypothetical protein PG997_004359 [Apiospora hydei]|uniref:Uncharacterized protein n=1 Tax=Apiospora hydei TaxID=1337664 RepID=A0ABR1X1U2_9PEZI